MSVNDRFTVEDDSADDTVTTQEGPGGSRTSLFDQGASDASSDASDQRVFCQPETNGDATLRERFLAYHEANPNVLKEILKLCYKAKQNGQDDWSINGIFERLRWHYAVDVDGDYEFKFSNDYRAIYARIIMYLDEQLDGFFRVHQRDKAKSEPDGWIREVAQQAHERLNQETEFNLTFNESPSFQEDGEGEAQAA